MVRAIPGVTISDQPENRPLGSAGKTVADRPEDKPPDIDKRTTEFKLISDGPGKIAIAAAGPEMDSLIAPLFDRAAYFLIVGFGSFKAIPNPNADDREGVGIQSAQLVVDEGAAAVITDNISLEAMKALKDLKVKVYSGVSGKASQAIKWYEDNRLDETSVGSGKPEEETHEGGTGKAMKDKMKFDKRSANRTSL